MELVVDTNVLIAGLLRQATTRELLLDDRLTLYTPEHSLTETTRLLLSTRIRRRLTGISSSQLATLLGTLTARIHIIPASVFQRELTKALRIAPHPEDAPYLALAMHLRIPLWSNDVALAQQPAVRVHATPDLLDLLP